MDVGRLRTRLAPALLMACAAGCASVFGPTTATSFMNLIERDPDPNVRYKAYQSLGQARVYDDQEQKARAAQLLVTKLDPRLEPLASRAVICRTLGELGDPVARDAMIRLCRDPDPLIRSEAYCALGKVGKTEDSTLLMQAMTLDQDDHCKAAAIEALGSLKKVDPRTESYLVRSLDSDDPRIRFAALRSLRKISGKDLGSKQEPWRAYVLAKYGEKIEPPNTAIADAGSRDPAASPASLFPSVRPPGSTPGGDVWSRSSETDDFGAPYLATRAATNTPQAPGQTPLPAPPTTGPKGVFSKIFGY
jgi:hypothetical protein